MIIQLNTPDPHTGNARQVDTKSATLVYDRLNKIIGLHIRLEIVGDRVEKKSLMARDAGLLRRNPAGELVYRYQLTEGSVLKWNGRDYDVEGDIVKDEDGNVVENADWATATSEYQYMDGLISGGGVDLQNELMPSVVLELEQYGRYDYKNGR